jgi:glycosyltransferase involved in cell wall biosynthesis
VTVSDVTRQRYARRVGLQPENGVVVPNSVDTSAYGDGSKRKDLLDRYGLANRTVLMTLARLDPGERYKGVDEVMEALPTLTDTHPDIAYLICGSGGDRERLEAKAGALGVSDRVVFAGYVPEEEKADHYRLADAFVMPGWGEGFGIVYLEALACGVPVVASSADASQEAVRNGELGVVVDPHDPTSVVEGIRDALARPKGVPQGLDTFSHERFAERWRAVAERAFRLPAMSPSP